MVLQHRKTLAHIKGVLEFESLPLPSTRSMWNCHRPCRLRCLAHLILSLRVLLNQVLQEVDFTNATILSLYTFITYPAAFHTTDGGGLL